MAFSISSKFCRANKSQKNNRLMHAPDMKLFWLCVIALSTTSFGFILRALTLPQWGSEFNLTNTQIGEIAGVGLWPFAISIVLFSLAIDTIGYKNAILFAFVCHITSAVLTLFATGYLSLYIATFIVAIGNGTVEAVINPVVATLFSKDKTKWLNILHSGWPGGLVLAGFMTLMLGHETNWKIKMILILIPTITYGVMAWSCKFPINERVKAGISYLDMLKEVGAGGICVVTALVIFQFGSIFGWPTMVSLVITIGIVLIFGLYVKSFGQPIFVLMIILMIPLATTELGTDSWISNLMLPEMTTMGMQAGWILVYTSTIMAVLRLFAGSIVHSISPLGLLAISSAIACVGLLLLSVSSGMAVILAATLFALGKTFFWPTMLGIVSELFPKGGALVLNITSGVGMIAAGVIGAVILGYVQDKSVDSKMTAYDLEHHSALHDRYATDQKESLFGNYKAINPVKLATATVEEQAVINSIRDRAKKDALRTVTIFPMIMLVAYLFLIFYFKYKGGYRAVVLTDDHSKSK